MNEQSVIAGHPRNSRSEGNELSQFLSFEFYKENLGHLTDKTRDSINNFLKTISEIEDEFVNVENHQQPASLGFLEMETETNIFYMEENY
jgi:hypothetical protein